MLESTIEKYLKKRVESIGGKCYKLNSDSSSGMPDRFILYKGNTYYVETKAPDKNPRKLQLKIHKEFSKCEITVFIIDTKKLVDDFIERIKIHNG